MWIISFNPNNTLIYNVRKRKPSLWVWEAWCRPIGWQVVELELETEWIQRLFLMLGTLPLFLELTFRISTLIWLVSWLYLARPFTQGPHKWEIIEKKSRRGINWRGNFKEKFKCLDLIVRWIHWWPIIIKGIMLKETVNAKIKIMNRGYAMIFF